MNETFEWKITQLRVQMLDAIAARKWKRMYEISAEIQRLQEEARMRERELIYQLWPGARVTGG